MRFGEAIRRWSIPRLSVLLALLAGMCVVQLVNSLPGAPLSGHGIWPRRLAGLPGIAMAPWIHASWEHWLANIPILLLLSCLAMLGSLRRYVALSLFVILGGGLLVWLVGRDGSHIGASGWVFGLWAWLLAQAWFRRSIRSLILGVLVLVLYGGIWWGLLPARGISFESHLAGAICGVVFVWWNTRGNRREST